MIKKIIYSLIALLILIFGIVQIKYDVFNKVTHIGLNPKHAFENLYQIVRKEGFIDTIYIIKNK